MKGYAQRDQRLVAPPDLMFLCEEIDALRKAIDGVRQDAGGVELTSPVPVAGGDVKPPRRGLLVAVEGIDASGKHTLCCGLADALQQRGYRPRIYPFPAYNSPTGQLIQGHLRGEWAVEDWPQPATSEQIATRRARNMLVRQCLMTCDRAAQVPAILAALGAGDVVILDRWWMSSLAYGTAEGLDPKWVRAVSSVLPEPDVWFLLDCPVEMSSARRPPRDGNERDLEKMWAAREAYLHEWIAQRSAGAAEENAARLAKWKVVDARLPPPQVLRVVLETVLDRVGH